MFRRSKNANKKEYIQPLTQYFKIRKNETDIKSLKRLINEIKLINIIYNENGKTKSESLFSKLEIKNEIIYFQLNNYISSKLSQRGRGRRKVLVPYAVFRDQDYHAFKFNSLRFFCLLAWFFEESDVDDNTSVIQIYKTKMQDEAIKRIINEYNSL